VPSHLRIAPRRRPRRAGRAFEKLVALQARLRAPGGCPWDREQTHRSLRTYLLEETYEALEALDARDFAKFGAELGDLLLQVVFHAQLAAEARRFDIRDVIERVHAKLVRRHPHVFGRVKASSAAQVLKNWEQLKAEERRAENPRDSRSLLDGVPRNIPAVLEAYQLTRRASRIGFDWQRIEGLLEKLQEEAGELRLALGATAGRPRGGNGRGRRSRSTKNREEEVGDLLFVAVNIARFLDLDPEITLKKANRKFAGRFRAMEEQASRQGRRLADVPREELERLWEQSKSRA
jgi:MazG family protein